MQLWNVMVLLILCWRRLGCAAKMECKGLPGKSVPCSPARSQWSNWLCPTQFCFWSLCSNTFLFSQNPGKNKKWFLPDKSEKLSTAVLFQPSKFHCTTSKSLHKRHVSHCTASSRNPLSHMYLPPKRINLWACVYVLFCVQVSGTELHSATAVSL